MTLTTRQAPRNPARRVDMLRRVSPHPAARAGPPTSQGGPPHRVACLVGGIRHDTLSNDDRHASSDVWDTPVEFRAGDAATLFRVTQAGFSFDRENGQGAGGYTRLTLLATAPGHAGVRVRLAGYTTAALTDSQLAPGVGVTGKSPYLSTRGNL